MPVITLAHYDDGKENYQSHEVCCFRDPWNLWPNSIKLKGDIYSIVGYGATKEKAFEDFKQQFSDIMKELKAFETMLFMTDVIENNIIDVDCNGYPLSKGEKNA